MSQVDVVAHFLEHGTEFENNEAWAFLNVSSLRRPGGHAIVCLDSYLSMNFDEEDEVCHKWWETPPKPGQGEQRNVGG